MNARVRVACIISMVVLAPSLARAQASASGSSLRFFGTGIGPPGQQDRVRIQIDDNAPGSDASAPCDIGAGSFTIDFWVRGTLADNPTTSSGGDAEFFDFRWIEGNVLVDRDIFDGSLRDWGVSVAGGFIRFGTGRADVAPLDQEHTVEGNTNVLTNTWRHVAVVRDSATGRKSIYVDGQLDYQSPPNRSRDDISYPNAGVPGQQTPWGPYIVLAAEKHDAGSAYPSFRGWMDEVRFWNRALSQSEILDVHDRVLPPGTSGLVGAYRFEEGSGTVAADSSGAGSPAGQVIAGIAGNGEWALRSVNAGNVAPVALQASQLPAGFILQQVVPSLSEATSIKFLPDGRLLIAQRGGTVRMYAGGQLLPAPVVTVAADIAGGERGLVGLALDPAFASNGFFYLYWTTPEPRNRVARFTLVGNTASPASELVIWQNVNVARDYHHGGNIDFGPDGLLYIATGDQFDSSTSQPLNTEDGKILRITSTGAIPPGNPFVGVAGARPTIWINGERNPFRFTWDFVTGRLYIGNVGGNSSDSWEEITLGASGANHGWPNQEGPQCFVSDCSAYTFPWYFYRHDNPRYFRGGPQASITVGPVYRSSAPGAWPARYQNNLIVGDYANRWIRRLVLDGAGNIVGDPILLEAPGANTIVDMDIGPDGALWFVTVGLDNAGGPDPGGSAVYRVAFTGGGNVPPVAAASAAPTQGQPPLSVSFSSAGSNDPDAGPAPLTYLWDFGDGTTSTAANPNETYSVRGRFNARLTVFDGADSASSLVIPITVGNAPVPTIATPLAGTMYASADVIAFSGGATDAEDGTIPAPSLTWRVLLVHEDHTHPFFGPVTGASGSFVIPTEGHEPEDTFYRLFLTARDSDGIETTVTRDIMPRIVELVLGTDPPSIPVFLDGVAENTPHVYESLVNYQHTVEAQQTFTLAGTTYQFVCWTSGGPRNQSFTMGTTRRVMVARYRAASGGTVSVAVPAAERNADWYTPVGTAFGNFFNAQQVCVGSDTGGQYQMGLQFPLAVPQGATITAAAIDLVGSGDNAGSPTVRLRAYNVDAMVPFVSGSLTQLVALAPLTGTSASWSAPTLAFGQIFTTPSLESLVQAVVSRPGWSSGNHIGFVMDTLSTGDQWRCARNFASGQPPVLRVTYSAGGAGGGGSVCCLPGDANADGVVNFADITAVLANFGSLYAGVLGPGDANVDGVVNFADVTAVLASFGSTCPLP